METVRKELMIGVSLERAFAAFLNEINAWWPVEYTWSKDTLKELRIEARKDGLCTETGPYGFRCDWGRLTEFVENQSLGLKWQISPKREPVPDPEKASDIRMRFNRSGDSSVILEFEHFNFENHGECFDEYRKMMGSELGWDYILNKFKDYCERQC